VRFWGVERPRGEFDFILPSFENLVLLSLFRQIAGKTVEQATSS
jgi:hypothetical protein